MATGPRIAHDLPIVELDNPAGFLRLAFEGGDVLAAAQAQIEQGQAADDPIVALMNLGLLYQLVGEKEAALRCQMTGLATHRLFRHAAPPAAGPPLRLLAVVTPGDLMANTPLELMLEGRNVEIMKLYVLAGEPLPEAVPDHDVAIVAVGETDRERTLLAALDGWTADWPRPLLNRPARILSLARDRLYRVLDGAPGILIPPTTRAGAADLAEAAAGRLDLERLLPGGRYPLIVRPVGSHAGKGLEKVDDPEALGAYLAAAQAETYYLSRFIDYRGADGHFTKSRIAVFDGAPHLAHLAAGDQWMVHYMNAGMAESEAKRRIEAAAMAGFDQDFARRHAEAFATMHARLGLEYFAIDCAETADGALFVFEADVAMIVHALDPEDLYPYKKPQMRKVFDAFEAMLRAAAGAG